MFRKLRSMALGGGEWMLSMRLGMSWRVGTIGNLLLAAHPHHHQHQAQALARLVKMSIVMDKQVKATSVRRAWRPTGKDSRPLVAGKMVGGMRFLRRGVMAQTFF